MGLNGPIIRPGWFLGNWTGLALANLILAVGVQPPSRPWTWAAEIISAIVVSLAETVVIARLVWEALRAIRSWWKDVSPAARKTVAAVVTLACALPVIGVVAWGSQFVRSRLETGIPSCDDPTGITALTVADFRVPIEVVARRFEQERTDDGCPSVAVHITDADRAQTWSALRKRWSEDALQTIGSRPDLWIADRAVDIMPAAASLQSSPKMSSPPDVVAHSPIRLASAGAVDQLSSATWQGTVERLRTLGRPVLRPEPGASAVGQLALLNDYPSARADPGGVAGAANQLGGEAARAQQRYETGYAMSFSRTGWRRADVPALLRDAGDALCRSDADPLRQAVLVLPGFLTTDQSTGANPPPGAATPPGAERSARMGSGIAGCQASQWPTLRTFPVSGDPVNVELAVTRLEWGETTAASAAARDFGEWLKGERGRAVFAELGWKPGSAGSPTDERTVQAATNQYQTARTTARLVIGVDTSTSMRLFRPEVTAAVTTLVEQLGPADQVGVFGFVRGSGANLLSKAVELGPARETSGVAGSRIARTRRWLATYATTDGDTPLAAAIDDGHRTLSAVSRPETARDTLLLLTDGKDLTDKTWAGVASQASSTGLHVIVLTLGDGSEVTQSQVGGLGVHVVPLNGDATGQQALRAATSYLWRAVNRRIPGRHVQG